MLTEASVNDLYQSTVRAFSRTRFREHAVQPIRITTMAWTPFLGLKTLLVRATATNEGRDYHTTLLFKNVRYGSGITLVASDDREYLLEQLSADHNDVLVKCQCQDFEWRFRHENAVHRALYGKDRKKYEGQGLWEANPLHLPGLCKHLLATVNALKHANILA